MATRAVGWWRWAWIALGAVLVAFVLVIHFFWNESTQVLDAQLHQKVTRMRAQLLQGGIVPSPETYAFLYRRTQQLQEQYDRLLKTLDPPGQFNTEGAQDPGLYFREQLHTLEKRLEREATAKGIAVTSTFGFSDDLPSKERVPLLLRQLALVEVAATSLITEGAASIDLVRVLEPRTVADPRTHEPFLWELPLVVRARCRTPTLVKFLYHMQQATPLVAVPEVSLKEAQSDEEGLTADLLLVMYAAPAVSPMRAEAK